MPSPTFTSRLRDLALALLNATLLLAVALVFGLWLLVGRLQHLAADTAEAATKAIGADLVAEMEGQVAGLGATLDSLKTLDTRLDEAVSRAGTADGPAVAELSGLRGDVQGLTAAVDRLNTTAQTLRDTGADALSSTVQSMLLDMAGRLAPPPGHSTSGHSLPGHTPPGQTPPGQTVPEPTPPAN